MTNSQTAKALPPIMDQADFLKLKYDGVWRMPKPETAKPVRTTRYGDVMLSTSLTREDFEALKKWVQEHQAPHIPGRTKFTHITFTPIERAATRAEVRRAVAAIQKGYR